jgi:amidase
MPYFKQETLDSSQKLGGLESKEYITAVTKSTSIRKFLDDLMKKNNLNALCGPATGASWCVDFVNGDFFSGYGAYGPAAMAGYPSITVPMGSINQLPIGLSFISTAYDEPNLIAIGYAYEQLSRKRTKPAFKPTYS